MREGRQHRRERGSKEWRYGERGSGATRLSDIYQPVMKAMALPMLPEPAAMAVAVVLSRNGNQMTEISGGLANVTPAATPFSTDPNTINL